MANEAVIIQELEDRHFQAVVADGTSCEVGSLMVFSSGDNVVAKSSADGDLFAGILMAAKTASDGATKVSLRRHCVAGLKLGTNSNCTIGGPVKIIGANLIEEADNAGITGSTEVIGIALKTGTASQTVAVLVGGY